jgi:hypothetical protein
MACATFLVGALGAALRLSLRTRLRGGPAASRRYFGLAADVLPDPATAFGERVRQRLREEQVIWFSTAGGDGTPQPNPVWFLWDDQHIGLQPFGCEPPDHIRSRPQVCLHLDGNGRGADRR